MIDCNGFLLNVTLHFTLMYCKPFHVEEIDLRRNEDVIYNDKCRGNYNK